MKLFTVLILILINSSLFAQENNEIKTVKIGNQNWTTQNLNIKQFRNGDMIAFASSKEEWEELCINKIPAYCFYNFSKKDSLNFGCYYNWLAVNDHRGLAPMGFIVPNASDMDTLLNALSKDNCGFDIKSEIGWGGTGGNSTGLNIIGSGEFYGGHWQESSKASFWTKRGSIDGGLALGWHVYEDCNGVVTGKVAFHCGEWSSIKSGYSIRLLKKDD